MSDRQRNRSTLLSFLSLVRWNDLPSDITPSPSLLTFKQRLKLLIFRRPYPGPGLTFKLFLPSVVLEVAVCCYRPRIIKNKIDWLRICSRNSATVNCRLAKQSPQTNVASSDIDDDLIDNFDNLIISRITVASMWFVASPSITTRRHCYLAPAEISA